MTWYDRPVLEGQYVRLEPLTLHHAEGLYKAGADPEVWTWLSESQPQSVDDMRSWVDQVLTSTTRLAWTQIDTKSGEVAGTTSYYDIDPKNRAVAIGYTWIGTPWQRSGINTESKLLLLSRAFDDLGAVRVVWHTHSNNQRSQRAIERLGALREGIHRKHKLLHDGTFRDTVVYSMLDTEWPEARERLEKRRQQYS